MSPYDLSLKRFPDSLPALEPIADDPAFDPAKHLQLERPAARYTLADLGYSDEQLSEPTPSDIAATDCFRVLSDEGVAALHHVCKQLEAYTTANPRISRNTRGGVYRSSFLRDLCLSPEITEHVGELLQAQLLPHAMGHQLAHVNYQPLTVGENVDKWHFDTLQVDYVMFVTDPNAVEGGEFQYFRGTRDEMAQLRATGQPIPAERVIAPAMPGPGYAVAMQGNYVVHQAKALRAPGERITFVNGYSFADPTVPDFTAYKQLRFVDAPQHVAAEYARQMAYRAAQHLIPCINRPAFDGDLSSTVQLLQRAQQELHRAIEQLEDASPEAIKHFGD